LNRTTDEKPPPNTDLWSSMGISISAPSDKPLKILSASSRLVACTDT
jgi:hypothetical protein